jgi:hypothetical protein
VENYLNAFLEKIEMSVRQNPDSVKGSTQAGVNTALLPISDLLRLSATERKSVFISSHSVFGDRSWDLSDSDSATSRHELLLKFYFGENCDVDVLPLLDSIQCFAYSLIVDPPHPRIRFSSIAKNLRRGGITNLVRFMVERKITAFSDLSREEFEAFLEGERNRPPPSGDIVTNRTLIARVRGIDWLVLQSSKLLDTLRFDPWQKYGSHSNWASVAAMKIVERGVLRTPVIPDEIVRKLILTAMQIMADSGRLKEAATAFNSHIPTYKNVSIGRSQKSGKLIYSKQPANPFPFNAFGFRDHFEMVAFYGLVRTATSILVGLLTGMRPIEILSIPATPSDAIVEEDIEVNGTRLKCNFVVSRLSKNLPTPQKRTWQTVPIVVSALRSLAAINGEILDKNSPWIFRSFKKRARHGHIHDARRLSTKNLSASIQTFVQTYEIQMDGWNGILSGRSLRRTVARLLTRNGLGLIELQDQLKHFDPDVSRMYGQPSLTLYMHEEKVSLSEELYQELLAGVTPIIGGGARNLNSMRTEFKGLTRPDQVRFIKSLSAKALIDQVDLGLCTYQRDRALCGGSKANCKPDECLNSIIPLDSAIRSLNNRKRENERLLTLIRTDSLKRQHLLAQLRIINNLINQADESVEAPPDTTNGSQNGAF